jgi:DNA-binding GntR family transcriptional regulator
MRITSEPGPSEAGQTRPALVPDVARPVERAYAGIREAILAGRLAPGAHLREEALAALTGTSRTPVREALRRLVAEGLATADKRHRYVTDFSREAIVIIFDVRARLESYAAQIAASKIGAEEIARLRNLIAAIDRVQAEWAPDGDRRFAELNAEFHRTILEAARSPQLLSLAAPALAVPLVVIKQFLLYQTIDVRRSNDQHRDILAALEARNGEWAASAMQGHILSTRPRPAP